jgi:hypothetical protein
MPSPGGVQASASQHLIFIDYKLLSPPTIYTFSASTSGWYETHVFVQISNILFSMLIRHAGCDHTTCVKFLFAAVSQQMLTG